MILARIAKARADVEAEPCHLCGKDEDKVEHVTACELVCGAYDVVSRGGKLPTGGGGLRTLMLQEAIDGGTLAVVLAFYAAISTASDMPYHWADHNRRSASGDSHELHRMPLVAALHADHNPKGAAES